MPTRQTQEPTAPGGRLEELSGVVEHVVFRSDDTGYTVFHVRTPGAREDVTVVGTCPVLWAGESVTAAGRWTRHREHGRQFQADKVSSQAPVNTEGIRKYLASGMIRGIGKVMAERLVEAFGEDTLNVIDRESGKLLRVNGIGPKRREQIKAAWTEQKTVRDIMVFLYAHRVGTAHAARIFGKYGNNAIATLTQDPYRLTREVWGIGFKTADKIAESLGISAQSPLRARAGVCHVLHELTDEGHCFCPRDVLVESAQDLLGIPADILRAALDCEIAAQSLVEEGANIYLAPLYHAETGVAVQMRLLGSTPPAFPPIQAEKAIAWAEQRIGLVFDPGQKEALAVSLTRKVSIITGGPGVGKTTIIRALLDVFRAKRLRVCLAAPTGRAAKRMHETTRHDAQTIHRLLRFVPGSARFEYGPEKPLDADVFILDEVSMLDIVLTYAFLRALPPCAWLVLVGDVDQLPSVGPGNVLRDFIESGAIPAVRLTRIFRQKERSWIVHNAHLVNTGQALELPQGEELADFYFIPADDPDQVIEHAIHLVTERIPARFRLDPRNDIQVLTPMQKNRLGAENLNAVLQQALNPHGPAVQRFGRTYRAGDRVMQVRNDYDKDVFNGDIGRIASVDEVEQRLVVEFDGRAVPYDFSDIDELRLAYASSIHKAQGSEFPAVVVLIATQHFKLLQRNLLYTALTRGRRLVCLVGSRKAVGMAIANNHIALRRTALSQRLRPPAPEPPGASHSHPAPAHSAA